MTNSLRAIFCFLIFFALCFFSINSRSNNIYVTKDKQSSKSVSWNCQKMNESGRVEVSIKSMTSLADSKAKTLSLTTTSAIETCEHLLGFDDDFNGDGQMDLSLSNDHRAATSTKKIILLDPKNLDLVSVGLMSQSAIKIVPNTYSSRESMGGSIYISTYLFSGFEPIQVRSQREARFGSFCICEKYLIAEDGCTDKGETEIATPDSPICFVIDGEKSESVRVDCDK